MSKGHWFFGRRDSTEVPSELKPQPAASPRPQFGSSPTAVIMEYGAEKAALQAVLTKRNATIGRLRAANRELRRELREHYSFAQGLEQYVTKRERQSQAQLVAEISPPPEPAFTGPLEVGGWYEDEQSRRWECVGCYVKVDGSSFICERNGIHQMYFRPDGTSEFILGVKLIRKVDPPGGES